MSFFSLQSLIKCKYNLAELDRNYGRLEDKKYICILDLELTCWAPEETPPLLSFPEVTEIGIVVRDSSSGKIVEEISEVVKPVRNYILSDFAKKLTGISQEEIDKAGNLAVVLNRLWGRIPSKKDFVWAAWGSDPEWLQQDMQKNFGYVEPVYDPRFINIKIAAGLRLKARSLLSACEELNVPQFLPAHRALPDAQTTNLIFSALNLSPLDASISSTRTYKQALASVKNDRVNLLNKRTNLDKPRCREILELVGWDHTKACKIVDLFR